MHDENRNLDRFNQIIVGEDVKPLAAKHKLRTINSKEQRAVLTCAPLGAEHAGADARGEWRIKAVLGFSKQDRWRGLSRQTARN